MGAFQMSYSSALLTLDHLALDELEPIGTVANVPLKRASTSIEDHDTIKFVTLWLATGPTD